MNKMNNFHEAYLILFNYRSHALQTQVLSEQNR